MKEDEKFITIYKLNFITFTNKAKKTYEKYKINILPDNIYILF